MLQEYYEGRIEKFKGEIAKQKKIINAIYYTRVITFILTVLVVIATFKPFIWIAATMLLVCVIIFLKQLKKEINTKNTIALLEELIAVNKKEINLLNLNFQNLDIGEEYLDKEHFFLSDLDIFGRRSIFQLLNRTSTFQARTMLANWLINPLMDKQSILNRQEAVKELSKMPGWSQQFIAVGNTNKEKQGDKHTIESWLKSENSFNSPLFKLIGVFIPVVTILCMTLSFFNIIDWTYFKLLFFSQLIITGLYIKKMHHIQNALGSKLYTIEKYSSLISLIENAQFNSEQLNTLKQQLSSHNNLEKASIIILKLKKHADALDASLNLATAILLNGMLLWNFNYILRVEEWKTNYKNDFLNWINIIARFDTYISLGMYAYNHPNYCYPEFSETFKISATDIAHPLIYEQKVISNNYEQGNLGKIDLLTGANMAGKSTFLRTIGVNLILAMLGVPVFAKKYIFKPIQLFTSLRTNDSLQDSESFFYAEIKRLQKLILNYEQRQEIFFLLDEILKGTNSTDQHLGSEALIKKLITLNGVGIIATHDVTLAKLANSYPHHIRNICFEITIENDKLNFDYKLKPGVCNTMNASFLLKKMGIG